MPLDPTRLAAAVAEARHEARTEVHTEGRAEVSDLLPPTFDDRHLYGHIGEYVRLLAPHTEAAPVAVYACALATVGALIGRGPFWHFGRSDHHARLFVLLIGATGAGRKGTALSDGLHGLLERLDPDFKRARVLSGLSSAEGLLHELRDGTPERTEPNGRPVPGDEGIVDKRLLVVEGELGSALTAMRRDGNRLSPVLRDAWDGLDLRTMTKKDPQRATAPHVVVVGAVTSAELKALVGGGIENGLMNRFTAVFAARVQLLPEDSQPDARQVDRVIARLRANLDRARTVGRITWSPAAQEQWRAEYAHLAVADDPSHEVRALLQRAAPMTRRIAMTLALADGTNAVDGPHLEGALALQRYAAASWRCVFASGGVRSPLAAKLLAALEEARSVGLSRTDLRAVAGSNNLPGSAIDAALAELAQSGLAHRDKLATAGRPVERWTHARHVGAGIGSNGTDGTEGGQPSGLAPISPIPLSSSARVRIELNDGTTIETTAQDPDLPRFAPLITRVTQAPAA